MTSSLADLHASRLLAPTTTKRQVQVLHLIESLGAGGAERLLHTNLRHLDSSRFRSTVMTVFSEPAHWVESINHLGVTVESLGCQSLRDLPAGITRLSRWLRVQHPDLMHTHLWAANVIGRVAGRMAGVPVISSVHNPDHEPEAWDDGSEVSLRKRRLVRDLDRWTARFGCERMVAVSEYVRRSAHRRLRFPLERIELIYNPIDADAFQSSAGPKRGELLGEYGIDEGDLMLLNVGRVTPQKGLLYALRALPLIRRRHPSVRLVSVGDAADGLWLARLETEARKLGVADRVHFLGARKDVGAFLRSCDLFIFPSLYEGLGIALIEAMASGRACVATRIGPIPEVLRHGVDGWLVEPASVESLAEGICDLLAAPLRRETLGRAAQAAALARFQPQPAAAKLAALYQSVVAADRRNSLHRGGTSMPASVDRETLAEKR